MNISESGDTGRKGAEEKLRQNYPSSIEHRVQELEYHVAVVRDIGWTVLGVEYAALVEIM